jgi:release factor glutamine methyltransferase
MRPWTIKKLLSWTEGYFSDNRIDSPRLTAEILLAHVLEMRRLDLYLQHDRPLDPPELSAFKTLIRRRIDREPVAYITGKRGFFNDTFAVEKGVLIPRPDTEVLVETAIETLDARKTGPANVLELGVGSGAIIVSVASACPGHRFFGCDISAPALATARRNAVELAAVPIHFFQGSWLGAVGPDIRFDLILSNPPYIPSADIHGLEPEIREHEPLMALDGGADGLDAYRVILAQAGEKLAAGGKMILEMGFDQKEGMTALAGRNPWVRELDFKKDLAGHNRLAIFKK